MTKFVRKHEIGGSRFGRLVVTNHISGGVWNCTCDCGNHKKHKGGDLVAGMYASCGCLLKEKIERSKLKIATNKKKFIDQVELRKYLSYDVLTGFLHGLFRLDFPFQLAQLLVSMKKSRNMFKLA